MHPSTQHLPAVIQSIAPLIHNYGYFAVGLLLFLEDFGILVPGETVLIAAAFYAGIGELNIVVVAIVAFIACVVGDNVGFAIGTYGGHPLVEKYGRYIFLTKDRLERTEKFFNRHGGKVVAIARFVDGLRELNGIIAGISEMRWIRFLLYNMIGAGIWVGVWTLIGYYGGSHISTFLHFELYFTLGVICLFALWMIYKRYIRPKKQNPAASDES